jgi:hypothetical protein
MAAAGPILMETMRERGVTVLLFFGTGFRDGPSDDVGSMGRRPHVLSRSGKTVS